MDGERLESRGLIDQGERRRFYRWRLSASCRYIWRGCPAGGRVVNFSCGGALVSSADALPAVGSEITLHVSGLVPVDLPAWVVGRNWNEQHGKFFNLEFQEPLSNRSRKLMALWKIHQAGESRR